MTTEQRSKEVKGLAMPISRGKKRQPVRQQRDQHGWNGESKRERSENEVAGALEHTGPTKAILRTLAAMLNEIGNHLM